MKLKNYQKKTTIKKVSPELVIGIEEFAGLINTISIYPNPAIDLVNIVSNDAIEELLVYNQFGQLVIFEKIENNTFKLNVAELKDGTYIIHVLTANSNRAVKFIKQ